MPNKVPTCVQGLDEITDGGLPEPSAVLMIGEVGAGKSLLTRQISWNLLCQNYNVLYYTVDESGDDVRDGMLRFGWDLTKYEKENKFHFIDVFSEGVRDMGSSLISDDPEKYITRTFDFRAMLREGREYFRSSIFGKKLFIVFDSISPAISTMEEKKVFQFVQTMRFATRITRSIGVAILHLGMHGPLIEATTRSMADTVIEVRRVEEGKKVTNFIRIDKIPGKYYGEPCPFEIGNNGIIIHKITIS
jgi:circadian clock protein KaiC